jgi:hypothetical protein
MIKLLNHVDTKKSKDLPSLVLETNAHEILQNYEQIEKSKHIQKQAIKLYSAEELRMK